MEITNEQAKNGVLVIAVQELRSQVSNIGRQKRREYLTEALRGSRVSPSTISDLNQKIYAQIEEWRNRPLSAEYPYVFVDGIWLKRCWGGDVQSISVLVAIGVNQEGYREILGVKEGSREDGESWRTFFRYLKSRGLEKINLLVSDKSLGLIETFGEFYPDAKWQRCVVHFYRNILNAVPKGKVKEVSRMLKAIHAQEDKDAARQKALSILSKLRKERLGNAAKILENCIDETLSYYDFPSEHLRNIRTNNL